MSNLILENATYLIDNCENLINLGIGVITLDTTAIAQYSIYLAIPVALEKIFER